MNVQPKRHFQDSLDEEDFDMKKEFQTPEIEIIEFSAEDIMTVSGDNMGDTDWNTNITKPSGL